MSIPYKKLHYSLEDVSYSASEFSQKKSRYCIVVVTLNEGERLQNQLRRMSTTSNTIDSIVADTFSTDGSTDSDFLHSVGVRTLLNTEAPGLAVATRIGYAYALSEGYEGVITVDGNGKDGVEAIPDFIKLFEAGYDLVQGSRFLTGGHHAYTPLERYVAIRFIMAPLLWLGCGYYYTDPTNAFRACSTRFLQDPRVQPLRPVFVRFNLHHYLNYRAARLKFRVTELPVSRVYPGDGTVPTKIVSFRTKLLILWEMIRTLTGGYNPE